MIGWHAFRVRRDGGIALPPPILRTDPERISRFELVRREVLTMVLVMAALIIFSIWSPAPIAAPIQLSVLQTVPESASAPWFFLWVQQMLKWGDPLCGASRSIHHVIDSCLESIYFPDAT
ncbi:MAG: hypothetical protein IPJ46_21575 [Anaerolineales bacterium]|nr:hypothetical protein [Anaerolineales bacterium]